MEGLSIEKYLELIEPFQWARVAGGGNTYIVFYQKNPRFGLGMDPECKMVFRNEYLQLFAIEAENVEDVFRHMQGECWSPKGEAKELIRSLGLHHTSMSVGDIIRDCTHRCWWRVESAGFSEVEMIF